MAPLAKWISILAHPFAMVAIMVVAAALHFGTPADAARVLVVVILFALLPVAVLMIRQVRRGSWTNVDASNRAERPLLFATGILGVLVLIIYLLAVRPESFLVRGSLGTLAMLAGCAAATRWIKVSLHMAFGALATTTLLLLGSPVGWALLAVMPALAWSRLALGRHEPVELVAGTLAGVASAIAIHSL